MPDLKGDYVTLVTGEQLTLSSVRFLFGLEIDANIFADSEILEGFNLQHHLLSFRQTIAGPGGTTIIKMVLSQDELPDSYFKFGPTESNPVPHWYEFMFDGETGAEIYGNEIILHFVDGKRGDSDRDGTNGIIFDPGAPAFKIANTGSESSSGGGCSLSGRDNWYGQAGAWWLLLTVFTFLRGWRYARKIWF